MTPTTRARRFADRAGSLALRLSAVLGVGCIVIAVLALALDLRLLTFRSGSMSPSIRTGALAVARSVPAADLRVGDVVSVRTATGSRVTHRVVAVKHRGGTAQLELRGDANRVSDATPYDVSRADRVWFSVPLLGYLAALVATRAGLVGLGLYGAYLLRVLLRRTGAAPPRGGKRKAPSRGARTARVAAAVLLLAGAGSAGALAARSTTTLAAWTDAAGTSAASFSTGTEATPASFTCGLLGVFSVTFAWSAVPGATSYTLHYGNGGSQVASVTGTTATVTALITGGTAWITAEKNYGSTTWTSAASNTRSYSVIALSICS